MELPLGVFKLTFFVVFIALTDFIPPNSFLQVFQTTFIFDSGLKLALVLASSQPCKFFPIIYYSVFCSDKMVFRQLRQLSSMNIYSCYFHWKVEAKELGDL